MQYLKEIISIIQVRFFGGRSYKIGPEAYGIHEKEGKVPELFKLIRDNEVKSDADAAEKLYGSPELSAKYRNLKSRLNEQLLNFFFSADFHSSNFSSWFTDTLSSNKSLALVRLLITLGARKPAIAQAQKALTTAIRCDNYAVATILCYDLWSHYGLYGNVKEYEHYYALYQKYKELTEADHAIQKLYYDITIHRNASYSVNEELELRVRKIAKGAAEISAQFPEPAIMLYNFRIQAFACAECHEFETALEWCDKWENYLIEIGQGIAVRLSEVYLFKMENLLHLGRYKEGEKLAAKAEKKLPYGTSYWFAFYEFLFLLAMKQGHYSEAATILENVMTQSQFQFQDEMSREKWMIYKAYNWFMSDSEEKFPLSRFLNDLPIFSKDKKGLNVAILIAQVLILLKSGRHNEISDRTDPLRTYDTRYLNNDLYKRVKIFIRMILLLERHGFDAATVKKKAAPYLKELSGLKMKYIESMPFIEIMPFERLWESVLSQLSKAPDKVKAAGVEAGSVE